MAKMGRPKINLDWDLIDRFLESGSTQEEIAKWLVCSIETLNARCKDERGMTFLELARQKGEFGKASLKREAHRRAMKASDTLAIFLMKNRCGMADKVVQDVKTVDGTNEELEKLKQKLQDSVKRE